MKKKLLLLGLMAALSTVGYAYEDLGDKNHLVTIGKNFDAVQKDVDGINNRLQISEGNIKELFATKADKTELDQKVDNKDFQDFKDKYYDNYNELHLNKEFTNETLKTHREQIEELEKNKVNKADQEKVDAAQNEKIDLADRINGIQNQQIGNLQSQNIEQNNRLDKVEKENDKQNAAIDKNKQDIAANKAEIENNKQNIAANKTAIDKEIADRAEADSKLQQQIDKFQGQMGNYGARLDNLENKVDNLDEKFNKGLSLMAAMNAVDFQNVSEGEMAIGAGFGHYGNAQSVAVGVAYAPTQNLNLNVKYSATAGDLDSFAIGAGASYKFRVK